MQSFLLPANGKATPESIKRKRRMAEAMMAQGMDASPIASPWQGAARMAQSLVGGMASRRADEQDATLAEETKREQMARQLIEDNWRKSGREHEWGQDAIQNQRNTRADAMAATEFQNQQDELQRQQDQRAAQENVYRGQITQTNPASHPNGMQGPIQPSYTPEQFNQAEMYAAGGDYGKAGELLNPIPDPKLTDDITEYGYYTKQAQSQGQQPVDFYTWQKSKSPMGQAGGEVGTIPPGFELFTTPEGTRSMRPIAGGPAALEADAAAKKAGIAETNKGVSADIVTEDIDRAISALDDPSGILPKTGFGANKIKEYGGTGAADLAGLLSSIEANVGFDALAQMRAASPTGGALGSITERELQLLAATKGAITQSQSKEQLKYNLNRLWNVTQDIVHGPNGGPPRRQLGGAQQNAPAQNGPAAPQGNPNDPLGIR